VPVSGIASFTRYERGQRQPAECHLPAEVQIRLHINGQEWVGLMCSPFDLEPLVLGFLRSESVITSLADVRLVDASPSGTCVDVWLRRADFVPPTRRVITSGCGGGTTFADLADTVAPIGTPVPCRAVHICQMMGLLLSQREREHNRGLHAAALADATQIIAIAEDVGRHNTIDRLWGHCLKHDLDPTGLILLSTGRISSEMLRKAAQMQITTVASRTSPTLLAVSLAKAWGQTLLGYVRRESMDIYSGAENVVGDAEEQMHAHTR
jgi:FdhD protein